MIQSSIIIPTKNGAAELAACLEGVYSQQHVGPMEVLVVDSGSTDETLSVLRQYPVRLEHIPAEMFHHARTRNFAAGLAQGEFLVFLSQDAIPASATWLAALFANFQQPEVGAVYGRQLPKPHSGIERRTTLASLYGDVRIVKRPMDGISLGHQYYHFSDANSAIRRKAWEATRFPEEFNVFEDVGIAKRMLDSGWSIVYEPEAPVYHSHDFPSGVLFKRYFDIGVVYQRMGIWNRTSRSSLWRTGWSGFKGKAFALFKAQRPDGVGLSLLKDIEKFAGIQLGRRERLIPRFVKKRLTLYRLFD